MMRRELKVIQDFYDFMLSVIQHTEKFPRCHRYSLGIAMESRLQRILELLLRAKFSCDKAGFLRDANMELEVLRFQIRLARDLKALPFKSHGYAARIMQDNPLERIMKEIRRRTRVVGSFPDGRSALMLVAARLRHIAGTRWGLRKYMRMDYLRELAAEQHAEGAAMAG